MKNVHNIFARTVLVSCMLYACTGCRTRVEPAIPQDFDMENKIEKILSRLTIEEKIGQMTQITLDVVGKGPDIYTSYMPFEFDEQMLEKVIHQYKVGSILNTATNTPFTTADWARIIGRLQQEAIEATGIPLIYGVDNIHGATYTIEATLFPQPIAMAATFNPDLVRKGAVVAAYEAKASNHSWNFSPVLDMGRDPRWSRQWETYGEDTYLVSVMGQAAVEAYQGDDPNAIGNDNIAASLKHYMGYGVPFSGKDRTPSFIDRQDMRERHFEPFLCAIRSGALSVMVNSGINNGVSFHADHEMITVWLKEELNWDGVVVTDWADINNLWSRDHIVETQKEAVALAINAGIDMSMVPYELSFCDYLKELVDEGKVSMDRIDDAVKRILRLKMRAGVFERPSWSESEYPDFASEEHKNTALDAASEAITLLKNNDNILPLDKGMRLLVCGPNADNMRSLNGGWTLSWQGEKTDNYASYCNTILEALQQKSGSGRVIYEPGITYDTSGEYWAENEPRIDRAVAAARGVDAVILCLGENSYCETPGNLDDLYLSENQQELAKALAATGKPVILILSEGRPRIISKIEPLMQAVVQTYLPGNYGGDALADILFGDKNPSGKLPYTYPRYPNSLSTYDHKPAEQLDTMEGAYDYNAAVSVQWPFGYGLSYTTFAYTDMRVDTADFTAEDTLTFSVKVRNTGKHTGKETAMLFINDEVASLTPDVRRLRAFEKFELAPGEERVVELTVPAQDLAFVNTDGRWILEQGRFTAQISNRTLSLNCIQTNRWETPNR